MGLKSVRVAAVAENVDDLHEPAWPVPFFKQMGDVVAVLRQHILPHDPVIFFAFIVYQKPPLLVQVEMVIGVLDDLLRREFFNVSQIGIDFFELADGFFNPFDKLGFCQGCFFMKGIADDLRGEDGLELAYFFS